MDLLKKVVVAEATKAVASAAGATPGQPPVIASSNTEPQFASPIASPIFSESPTTEANAKPPDKNENFNEATNSELLIKLVQPGYLNEAKLWWSIVWRLITTNLLPIALFITYVVMLGFQSTKLIIIGLYIFGGIFWGFFPYYLKCIMLFKITGIATCTHRLVYPLIGLIFWIIALSMHN
jgi:hypothetical protein